MNDEGRLLKVDEVAELLRTDRSTVRRKIRAGELAAARPCGHYLVTEAEVARFLEASRVQPAAPPARSAVSRTAPTMPPPPTGQALGGSFRSRRRKEATA